VSDAVSAKNTASAVHADQISSVVASRPRMEALYHRLPARQPPLPRVAGLVSPRWQVKHVTFGSVDGGRLFKCSPLMAATILSISRAVFFAGLASAAKSNFVRSLPSPTWQCSQRTFRSE